ncbi:alpha/beta hydrolase fold domain-containing protein [Actinomadura sp. LD22]|uniref:Alpha/beta hydrolase fold domain-containing protein n=1 Tax=Actinomadura physcomitrii TaxID=2650748 RepID=A0A6I4MQR0_9ACTN|nr:alpha/beta hydrolase fold domain-containing protein [Actinomadura physcomitrii]
MLEGVEYAVEVGYRPLELDLYLPSADGAPVVLFVHGGGWQRGTRREFGGEFAGWRPSPLERIAEAGFAVASVGYRLSREAPHPAQLHDVRAAVGWLREHGGEHGFDGSRIVAWGQSAGAHLAALAALTGPGIAAVVGWYGVYDLSAMPDPDDPETRESRLLGAPVASVPDLAAEAGPINHVHAGAPPFQLWHGTADGLVPMAQSERMAEALRAAGVPVEFRPVEGADHSWRNAPDVAAVFAASLDFTRGVWT